MQVLDALGGFVALDQILRASQEPQESDETWAGDDSDEDDDEDVDDVEDQHSSGSVHKMWARPPGRDGGGG